MFSSLESACPECGSREGIVFRPSRQPFSEHQLCAKHCGEYAKRQDRIPLCKGLKVGREEKSHSPVIMRGQHVVVRRSWKKKGDGNPDTGRLRLAGELETTFSWVKRSGWKDSRFEDGVGAEEGNEL